MAYEREKKTYRHIEGKSKKEKQGQREIYNNKVAISYKIKIILSRNNSILYIRKIE